MFCIYSMTKARYGCTVAKLNTWYYVISRKANLERLTAHGAFIYSCGSLAGSICSHFEIEELDIC